MPLTPKAYETLVALVEGNGHVVEKDELIRQVWPDTFVEEGNLSVNIFALRKALGEDKNGRQYIETVPKRGYRFIAEVRKIEAAQNGVAGTMEAKGVATQELSAQERAAARDVRVSSSAIAVGRQSSDSFKLPARKTFDSLAVLPLLNASDDPHAEYLSDGITESIINSLAQLPQLRVSSRSAVFRYKGREVDPQEAGRELGVRAALSGRVLQLGESLIVRVELVDVDAGWQLWGEQYNRKPADVLQIQEEISREISEKLRLRLTGEEKRLLTKRYTENAEAYQAYLKGRYYWNKRTPNAFHRGIEYFKQAISLDPKYALAYAGLADCYVLLGSVEYGALAPKVAMPEAREAALSALKHDDELAEAHTSLGNIKMFIWEWPEAEREFKRAIELNPNYATAHHWYALYLMATARPDEALREITRAQQLDPLSLPINLGLGWHFFLARDYERAVEEFRKVIEMEPNFALAHWCLGLARAQQSIFNESVEEFKRAHSLSPDSPLMFAALGYAYALDGKTKEARRIIRELAEQSKMRYISPYLIAAIYTALGEKDSAINWLEKAYEGRSEGLVWLKVDPIFDSLRTDPRFADILRRVGLAS